MAKTKTQTSDTVRNEGLLREMVRTIALLEFQVVTAETIAISNLPSFTDSIATLLGHLGDENLTDLDDNELRTFALGLSAIANSAARSTQKEMKQLDKKLFNSRVLVSRIGEALRSDDPLASLRKVELPKPDEKIGIAEGPQAPEWAVREEQQKGDQQ